MQSIAQGDQEIRSEGGKGRTGCSRPGGPRRITDIQSTFARANAAYPPVIQRPCIATKIGVRFACQNGWQ